MLLKVNDTYIFLNLLDFYINENPTALIIKHEKIDQI